MATSKILKVGVALLPALLCFFSGCGDDDANLAGPGGTNNGDGGGGDGGTPPWGTPPAPGTLAACDSDAGSAAPDKSSGYLLLPESRLAKVRADAAANAPTFAKLKANVDQYLTNLDEDKAGGENAALMYLLTSDKKYADSAYAWAERTMAEDLQGGANGNYLDFGDMMRVVALTLNWAKDGLDTEKQKTLADYLHASCDELWNHPRGSKFGLDDNDWSTAGNNFRMAFIEGTAYAGYALQALGDSRGKAWIDLAIDKLERKRGVLEYIQTYQIGGDWLEGSNYGQRSKQRLYHALAVIASMGGKNYFNETPFFANSIQFAVYQVQPKNGFLCPAGDLARSATNEVSPYDREYVQIATYWLCDSPARRLGQHYLTNIIGTYQDSKRSFDYHQANYLDIIYSLDIPAFDAKTLPLSYRSAGTNWVNARSGWDDHATSVSISGSPIFFQDHQHQDMGSFVMWKEDWLAVDPETFGGDGPYWPAEMGQGLFVPNRQPRYSDASVPGLTHFADKGAAVYVQVDNSNLYVRRVQGGGSENETLMNEHTRELVYLRPDTMFVFDRVDAKPGSTGYKLNFHFPSAPAQTGSTYTATNKGAGITFAPLLGGAITAHTNEEFGSTSHRLEQAATGQVSRFLSVLQVGSSGAPAISPQLIGSPGTVRGAVWNDTVVVFSDLPRGAVPPLPLTYTVPGTGNPTHMLVNMPGSYKVTATRSGGNTTVTVAAGNEVTADPEGVLVVVP